MFRIKKDDYNTVQFMPEYNSSAGAARRKKQQHSRRYTTAIIIIIVLLIIAVIAGLVAHFTYFSPKEKYNRAFAASDFDTCQLLAEDNAFDASFVEGISDTMLQAGNDILADYKDGKIGSSEAITQLNKYDEISYGSLSSDFESLTSQIQVIENVTSLIGDAEASCMAEKYSDAYDSLTQAAEGAEQYSVDLSEDISRILTDYIYGFKNAFFTQFASQIRSSDYDEITNTCNFVLQYITDEDFSGYLTTVEEVRSGDTRATVAARDARNIASQARDDEAQQLADNADENDHAPSGGDEE